MDIGIAFSQEPLGCRSDDLVDVFCYKMIAEKVIESVKGKSFHLIEFLAAYIFEALIKHFSLEGAILEIRVTKPHHPVAYVQKGIVFKYRRRVPQKSL